MSRGQIEVIVGTSEEFILGYQIIEKEDGTIYFKQSFTNHSHCGSIRQVAISGNFLVSGGTDENIKIFNLLKRKEIGMINEHQGTITNLQFYGKSHLFTASDDGNIGIFRRGHWQCEKILKAHIGGVTGFSVHPSGKIGLSIGRDKTLKTWNLIKGRRAFITNIKTVSDSVHWCSSGTSYTLVTGSCVDVYDVESCALVHSIDFKENIYSLIYISDNIIAIGGEGKNICLYDTEKKEEVVQWEAHTNRIKALTFLPRLDAACSWLISCSSDGYVKLWSLQLASLKSTPKKLGEINSTCRIICMDIYVMPTKSLNVQNNKHVKVPTGNKIEHTSKKQKV